MVWCTVPRRSVLACNLVKSYCRLHLGSALKDTTFLELTKFQQFSVQSYLLAVAPGCRWSPCCVPSLFMAVPCQAPLCSRQPYLLLAALLTLGGVGPPKLTVAHCWFALGSPPTGSLGSTANLRRLLPPQSWSHEPSAFYQMLGCCICRRCSPELKDGPWAPACPWDHASVLNL